MLDSISHYRIEAELGRGGMGVVYRAVDRKLGRPVAIKMLPAVDAEDSERHLRLVREAQAASALNHPNIVTIHEIGEETGRTFIVMELVDGQPLSERIGAAATGLPVGDVLRFGVEITSALAAAHGHGIVHRDIKPANIVVTRDGRAKVLDFGLARVGRREASDSTITGLATRPGTLLGTLAYMSPEQAEGRTADARSDVFSLGAVLYEMLTGRRPFASTSDVGLLTAILRDDPPPLRSVRPDVPPALAAIVSRALSKAPAERYPDAVALHADLVRVQAALVRPGEPVWRRPVILLPVALLLVSVLGFAAWQTMQFRRAEAVRTSDLPEIERLQFTDESLEAVRLAKNAERFAHADVARIRQGWFPFDTTTDPEGAHVSIRNYADLDGEWEPLGDTPIRDVFLPQGLYRIRITKPGYVTTERSYEAGWPTIRLVAEHEAEAGMVRIDGGTFGIGVTTPAPLSEFWLSAFEVTNREFKRFVDDGGYTKPEYWKEPFRDRGRVLTLAEATARFRDATDRPGPSTWELGSYPEGQDEYPVGGISWFEASAYAVYAGRRLPTLYHWLKASGIDHVFSDMLRLGRFDSRGPLAVGVSQSVGPWGAYDMAGNIKEWCVNEAGGTGLRYIVGGGWNEPHYRFREPEARDPWTREATFGVRLMKSTREDREAAAPVAHVYGDPKSLVPASDEQFALIRGFYTHDETPLDVRVEDVDTASPHWVKERVSYAASYGGERITAYLFLPKHATPPYQTVVLFPSSYARVITTSQALDVASFDFIVRSGRALLYPVYYGTYERQRREAPGLAAARDRNLAWARDFFQSVDFVESRADLDRDRIAYYSLSLGAFFGPIPLALEPRIKAAVLAAGGLRFTPVPELQTANFMPRVKMPVLLINGRDDFAVPPEARERFLELLGTPPADKKLVELDGGHVPSDMRGFYREVLNWFDKYLGTVK